MTLTKSVSKNSTSLYVTKCIRENGKRTTKVVEKLGTMAEVKEKSGDRDPIEWAEEYVKELTRQEKEGKREILVKMSPSKSIPKDEQRSYNGGYLFLQQIYHELGLDKICGEISQRHKYTFDMDSILSRLLYARVIFPASKLATCQLSKRFIEQPNFELQHIYRALEVIAGEMDYIQSALYKNSMAVSERNTGIIYYDCTNYFFEIEQADGLKQYGVSKEHRPNPIVQMGLFMDGDGIPLAFTINDGNTNEQITLQPLEKKILSDFALSKFVVCTDAGLASNNNRKFNDQAGRAFITTQSLKSLKKFLMDWALAPEGWKLTGDDKVYVLTELDEEKYTDKTFYKEQWINEKGLEQRLIVTYSVKYKNYQRKIRDAQIERAQKAMKNSPTKLKKSSQNDYKRFIKKTSVTDNGELADKDSYTIDSELVAKEAAFDGFYGVCTNLEDDVSAIIKVNHRRWEIEECFRIMKSEFKARPVYLSRDDRIKAHFTTCFLSLILYRYLEKKLRDKYTCCEIVDGLRNMNFYEIKGEGYIPTYTRTDFTDDLHEAFDFRTDYQIVSSAQMKKLLKLTKAKQRILGGKK